MLNFFKQNKRGDIKEHVAMIKNISQLLGGDFDYITKQINEGIIKDIRWLEKSPISNYHKFKLDVTLLNKYEDKIGRCFLLKNIKVFDREIQKLTEINLVVAYGLLIGYSSPGVEIINPNINKIVAADFYIQYFGEDEFNQISSVFSKEELKYINPGDVYSVKIMGKAFYHISDLEDGDFIAIDSQKNIYKITHDPYEITNLNSPLSAILSNLSR